MGVTGGVVAGGHRVWELRVVRLGLGLPLSSWWLLAGACQLRGGGGGTTTTHMGVGGHMIIYLGELCSHYHYLISFFPVFLLLLRL